MRINANQGFARDSGWSHLLLVWLAVGWLSLFSSLCIAQSATDDDIAEIEYTLAQSQIAEAKYREALQTLRLLIRDHPGSEWVAPSRTRISVLAEAADSDAAIRHYLKALDLRDAGDSFLSIEHLRHLVIEFPSSTLVDDALYLMAYIHVLDRYDFQAATELLLVLENLHADSAYADAAEYLNAIALEQMGKTAEARTALLFLRDKHTALSLPFGYRWPKGNVMSRYWYERATDRLRILDETQLAASVIRARNLTSDGVLELAIHVEGMDLDLLLTPSPLTRTTAWRDGDLSDTAPPMVAVYSGVVKNRDQSWARVVLGPDTLGGIVKVDGQSYRLQPDHLMGTLDYYQPLNRAGTAIKSADGSLSLEGDALVPPPENLSTTKTNLRASTGLRVVPLSIVIDSQFDRYHNGAGLAVALNYLNIADGFYRQFGMALSLDETVVLHESEDPMDLGPTRLETVLRTFRDYRMNYSTLFSDSALVYLFSGNPRTDATIGLAWIDTACRTDGYDVGVATPSGFGDVLVAHELGHSLGSPHDTDTQCQNDTGYLMWPNISSRTAIQLSSCSASSVAGTRAKSCLKNAVDLTLSANTDGNTVAFTLNNPETAVAVDASVVLETNTANVLHWPAECTVEAPTRATCVVLDVPAAGEAVLAVSVNAENVADSSTVNATATALEIFDPTLANNTISTHLLHNSADNPVIPAATPNQTPSAINDDAGAGSPSAGRVSWFFSLLLAFGLAHRRHWRHNATHH